MSWVGEERIESLCDVNYVDIGFIYQIICRQVQRNPNTYKWSVMGVPLIEILILIVFGHLRDPRQPRVTRGGGRVMMSSDQLIKYQLTSNWDLPCFCWFRDWVVRGWFVDSGYIWLCQMVILENILSHGKF